jgi:hypothetical protein
MRFTGPAADLPEHERLTQAEQEAIICYEAARQGVQATFLAAIRIAEGGRPGREFGVLSADAPDYGTQAEICARSIRNNLFRFMTAHSGAFPVDPHDRYTRAFIAFMADRWAPRGAGNDPSDLNANWPQNVRTAYEGSALEP